MPVAEAAGQVRSLPTVTTTVRAEPATPASRPLAAGPHNHYRDTLSVLAGRRRAWPARAGHPGGRAPQPAGPPNRAAYRVPRANLAAVPQPAGRAWKP